MQLRRPQTVPTLMLLVAVATLLVGVTTASATNPQTCRPRLEPHPLHPGFYQLISSKCPSDPCTTGTCAEYSPPISGGWLGCGCPNNAGTCILVFKVLAAGYYDAFCHNACASDGSSQGTCPLPTTNPTSGEIECGLCQ